MTATEKPFPSSLDDLLDELRSIDANQNPERAAELGRRIGLFSEAARNSVLERRSSRRPLSKRGRVTGYTSTTYPVVLVVYASVLLLINSIQLARGRWIALLPLSIQVSLLVSMAFRHFSQVYIVRLWSLIGIIGGSAAIISLLARLVVIAVSVSGEPQQAGPGLSVWISLVSLPPSIYFFAKALRSTKFERGEFDLAQPSPGAV